tara:strand:- start:4179 stop:4397 length:219 start_codon:yes stop_codon:yes gene_type:complete
MSLEKDIESLHNYESFARFIKVIEALREECIGDMHEASTEHLQQISGRIITYDQILQMVDLKKLEKRHKDFL